MVERREMGVKQDTDFHDLIAEASGNSVLAAICHHVALSRLAEQRHRGHSKVGTRLVVDHEDVIKSIREKNPQRARESMEKHIDRLISDVDHYWEQSFHTT